MRCASLLFLFGLTSFLFVGTPFASAQVPPSILDQLSIEEISYLTQHGILEAELDGSVQLSTTITRSEFVYAIAEYVYTPEELSPRCLEALDPIPWPGLSYSLLFRDVPKDVPYALHLCAAMRRGIIWGYQGGNFLPDRIINFAEAAKILTIAFEMDYEMPDYPRTDWYTNYISTLDQYAHVPEDLHDPAQEI